MTNITKNGVKITFQNNIIKADFTKNPPLLVYGKKGLEEINFDGYLIEKLEGDKNDKK